MNTTQNEKRRRQRKRLLLRRVILSVFMLAIGITIGYLIGRNRDKIRLNSGFDSARATSTLERLDMLNSAELPDWIDVQLIPIDGVSRDGVLLGGFNDIVIHYVGNPGTSAQANHDFYCNPESEVSSHFIVGLDGEIIQCIPLNEMSAASNWRNRDTISIEVCHPDTSGKFNTATYNSLVKLTAWLMQSGGLSGDHIIRHYDITGKECPVYYVENEDAWEDFKKDVKKAASK